MKLGYSKVLWVYSSKYSTKYLCVNDLGLGLCPNLLSVTTWLYPVRPGHIGMVWCMVILYTAGAACPVAIHPALVAIWQSSPATVEVDHAWFPRLLCSQQWPCDAVLPKRHKWKYFGRASGEDFPL